MFFVQNNYKDFLKGRLCADGKRKMSKLNRFLNGKGFYVALGICMIAIGISAWSAIDKVSAPPKDLTSDSTARTVSDTVSENTQVNKEQSDVPAERKESSSEISSIPETVSDKVSSTPEQNPVANYFLYPVVGEVIKNFSATELQYSVTFNDMRLHKGVDIKADEGTAVKASGEGKVTEIVNDPSLGYTVKIDHGNGMVGVYSGLAKSIAVEVNEIVKSGTNLGPLGTVPNECLDAPHLHLEFYKDGEAVDPLEFLEK